MFCVLLCDDQSDIATRREQKGPGRTKFIIFTGPRKGVTTLPHRVTGEAPGLGQVAEQKSKGKG